MKSDAFIKKLEDVFINSNPEFYSLDLKELELSGIRIVNIIISNDYPRRYPTFDSRQWKLKTVLFEDSYISAPNKHYWDMTTDGDYLCFRLDSNIQYIFQTEELDEQQIYWLKYPELSVEEINKRREKLMPILIDLLIEKMYPFSKLFSGELETKYGVHLKMIQKGEHQHMRYKPGNSGQDWVRSRTLTWGGSNGWDITSDCAFACCRVGYDEYYNFKIEVLGEKQVEYYKKKYGMNDTSLLIKAISNLDQNKLAGLKAYLDQLLMAENKS